MTVSVSQILSNVSTVLRDTGTSRHWPDTELLAWLNLGQRQIATLKPDAVSRVTQMQLAAGKSLQVLPDGTAAFTDASGATLLAGMKLIDIVRNLGADGQTPGRAVSIVDRSLMDNYNPEWHAGTPAVEIQHFMYNEKAPRVFYVYPVVHGSTPVWVEITYSFLPSILTSGQSIELPDEYEGALMDYVLFRAYSKEQDSPVAATKAAAYFESYQSALDRFAMAEVEHDPNDTPRETSPSYQKR